MAAAFAWSGASAEAAKPRRAVPDCHVSKRPGHRPARRCRAIAKKPRPAGVRKPAPVVALAPAVPPGPAQPGPPNAGPVTVSDVTPTSAVVSGVVSGGPADASWQVMYGPAEPLGAHTDAVGLPAGTPAHRVTRLVAGLSPGTTYLVRLAAGATSGANATFTTAPAGPAYVNPVFGTFPDPMVLDTGTSPDRYWAYGTGDLFPLARSDDLVHWSAAGTAFTTRPAWATTASDWHPWAPSVLRAGGTYVMYYTALGASAGVNCVGVATASTPGGPFTDQGILDVAGGSGGAMPLGCGDAGGRGEIDPAPFVDADGRAYLYVSTDFACDASGACRLAPTMSVIPLSADLLHAAGPRQPLFSGDTTGWESLASAPTVEAPWMERRGSTYYLFYSGGSWTGAYGTGYASAPSPTGPFTKWPGNPILSDGYGALSVGGGSIVTGPNGGQWYAYHGRAGDYSQPRTLRIDAVVWHDDGSVSMRGPTTAPQAPSP